MAEPIFLVCELTEEIDMQYLFKHRKKLSASSDYNDSYISLSEEAARQVFFCPVLSAAVTQQDICHNAASLKLL